MKNIDVSFITINYNFSNLTVKLVESIISKTKDLDFEIIHENFIGEDKIIFLKRK